MRIRPNYGIVLWLGILVLAIPLIVIPLAYQHPFSEPWKPTGIEGIATLGFFGVAIFLYGLLSSRIYLEFDQNFVRYHGYIFIKEVAINPFLVFTEQWYSTRQKPAYRLAASRSIGGENVFIIRCYRNIFLGEDLKRFFAALTEQTPHVKIDQSVWEHLG